MFLPGGSRYIKSWQKNFDIPLALGSMQFHRLIYANTEIGEPIFTLWYITKSLLKYRFHRHHRSLADRAGIVTTMNKWVETSSMNQMTTWWDVRRNSWCMNILQTNRTIGSAHLFHTLKDKKVWKMKFNKFNKMPTLCWFSSFLGRHISHVWQWKNLSLPPTLQIPRKRTNNINCQIIFNEIKITTSFTVILFFIFIINQLARPTKILQNKVNYVVVGKIIITLIVLPDQRGYHNSNSFVALAVLFHILNTWFHPHSCG